MPATAAVAVGAVMLGAFFLSLSLTLAIAPLLVKLFGSLRRGSL